MRPSWKREVTELLAKLDPAATMEKDRGGHVRIVLSNGARITISATPGDWRSLNNLKTRVRRELRASKVLSPW